MDTQTQIERLIDLAIIQRSELKKLVSELPQLREHLNAEIERVFEDAEPQLRTELEDWTTKQAKDQTAKLGGELEAKIAALSKSLEATTQTRYNAIMAERAQNIDLAKKAEDKLAEVAQAIPVQVKQIVTDELARFPRAGEIDQLRKEFAEPRGLNPRGRWQVGETYNKLDLVSYNGDSYVSNTDGNREKPSRSSEAWTLSAARGNGGAGGGVTSLTDLVAVPANGELLIGNGSAFVNNTLTAGTGVTITNGPGTITIDASGAQEILTATVTNAESFAITRGQVVYLFGATGNRASVKLADNSNDAASSKTFGVVSEASIAAGANGLVTCVGVVDKLTLGSYTEGDVLYLGATPGAVTNVKPYAPNHLVYVGMVERANNGNGELYVRIQNGYELDEIHDVQITTPPLAGSLLMRDATNSLWKANRLTGTANQVTVTNADTSVTLSLPTAIANVNSVTAATTQNLTLAGGSTGASLVLGQGASGNLVMSANSAERARFTATGNLLIGTTTDTSSRLKLVGIDNSGPKTWTASSAALSGALFDSYQDSGGNGFQRYTDIVSLQDSDGVNGGGVIRFVTNSVASDSGIEAMRVTKAQNLLIGTTTDGGQKLQVAGTAAFTGAVSTTSTGFSATNASGSVEFLGSRSSTGNGVTVTYKTGATLNWFHGLRGLVDNNWYLFNNSTSTNTLIFDYGTNAATFAGAVSVNSVTPSTGAGSGALQVAGGIYSGAASVFGGAVTTQSSGGDSGLIIKRNSSPYVDFYDGGTSGTIRAEILADNDGVSGGNFKIQTRNNAGTITLAATFDKAQAATFAGAVSAQSTLTVSQGSTFGGGGSEITGAGYLRAVSGYAKTDTSTRNIAAFSTNEAAGSSFKLLFSVTGNATLASRVFDLQTSNEGVSDTGILRLQNNGGTVSVGGAATFAGAVIAPAATTAISSVRLPHGTAPTSPVNGDMWTTTAGLYVRINGVTVGPLS